MMLMYRPWYYQWFAKLAWIMAGSIILLLFILLAAMLLLCIREVIGLW